MITLSGLYAMTDKTFRLAADQLRPMAVDHGSCLASDRITVAGAAVDYCYRDRGERTNMGKPESVRTLKSHSGRP